MTRAPRETMAGATFHTRNQVQTRCTDCEWASSWCATWLKAGQLAARHRARVHPELVAKRMAGHG